LIKHPQYTLNCVTRKTMNILKQQQKFILMTSALLLVAIVFVLVVVGRQIRFVDDAWITFRFAHNIANHGVWSINLHERVEGVSNLLWAVVLAPGARLLSTDIPVFATYAALILTLYALLRLWRIGVWLELHPLAAAIPPLFLILTPDFYRAATNGLEMPLFSVLLLDALYAYLRGRYSLAFTLLGLLFLTRLETLGIGLFLLVLLLVGHQNKPKKPLYASLLLYAGIVLGATLLRWMVYGQFLPNSVQAKQVPLNSGLLLSGARYILDFALENPLYLTLLAAATLVLIVQTAKNRAAATWLSFNASIPDAALVVGSAILLFSYVVTLRNGGDWMPNFRLLTLYGVVYALLLGVLLRKGAIPILLGVAILVGPVIHATDLALDRLRHDSDLSLAEYAAGMPFWGAAADRLASVLLPSDVVSAEALGYIGYQLLDNTMHTRWGWPTATSPRTAGLLSPMGKPTSNIRCVPSCLP
jgi:hypothetical protein